MKQRLPAFSKSGEGFVAQTDMNKIRFNRQTELSPNTPVDLSRVKMPRFGRFLRRI